MLAPEKQAYHLSELQIARDPGAAGHILPPVPAGCGAVLDIGCGAGQTLIAMGLSERVLACGIDPDEDALALGRALTDRVHFVAATGESLPYASDTFDLVFSRVALPYTNIPVALREMARVLRPGGTAWLSLHPPEMVLKWGAIALRDLSIRRTAYVLYLLGNAVLLSVFDRQVAWPIGRRRYESCQTSGGIERALRRAGLEPTATVRGRFFVVTAKKPGRRTQALT